jgi:hypothetical protein
MTQWSLVRVEKARLMVEVCELQPPERRTPVVPLDNGSTSSDDLSRIGPCKGGQALALTRE